MDKPHKKLNVWKESMELVRDVYVLTSTFPSEERFGLTSQMRRAAISIPSNVAEGAARRSKKEFRNFVGMAQGSLSELDTQFELAVSLGYLSRNDLDGLEERMLKIDKMLSGLIRSLTKETKDSG
jgi:four helix bundle protein